MQNLKHISSSTHNSSKEKKICSKTYQNLQPTHTPKQCIDFVHTDTINATKCIRYIDASNNANAMQLFRTNHKKQSLVIPDSHSKTEDNHVTIILP